jgi:hypothetical protein
MRSASVAGSRSPGARRDSPAPAARRLFHQALAADLDPWRDGRGRRADEDQAGIGAGMGEAGVLGQEAVAGVDRLRAVALRRR